MDHGPPGSSVHGIFQARVLEWGAIAFTTQELLLTKKMKSDLRSLGDQIAYFLELKHLTPISKLPRPSFRWCLQRGNKLAEYGFSPTDSAGTRV